MQLTSPHHSPSEDIGVNPFFDELFKHWNVRLRSGVTTIPIDVEDSDDEATDFGDFMAVKEDPYLSDPHEKPNKCKAKVIVTGASLVEAPLPHGAAKQEPAPQMAPVVTIDDSLAEPTVQPECPAPVAECPRPALPEAAKGDGTQTKIEKDLGLDAQIQRIKSPECTQLLCLSFLFQPTPCSYLTKTISFDFKHDILLSLLQVASGKKGCFSVCC